MSDPTHDSVGNAVPTASEWFAGGKPLTDQIRERDAEITSLRAQLEEARRKAIEECAVRVLIVAESNRMKHSQTPELVSRDQVADMLDRIEKSIRALLSAPTEARSALEASNKGGK